MGVESLLKAGIKALPDKPMQGQRALNLLKKKGVKAEEFKFSGVEIQPDKKYSKAELTELEANRKDEFGKVELADTPHQWVSLEAGQYNPTYKENVYTFSEGYSPAVPSNTSPVDLEYADLARSMGYSREELVDTDLTALAQQIARNGHPEGTRMLELAGQGAMPITGPKGSRYTSEHFPDVPNYLMHTRTFDDTLDGKPTRVLQEIQSDLHQEGRVRGYDGDGPAVVQSDLDKAMLEEPAHTQYVLSLEDADPEEVADALEDFGVSSVQELRESYNAMRARSGLPDTDLASMSEEEVLTFIRDGGTTRTVPKSPYEKSWLAKGIERELDSAIEDGRQQLAIPIKGAEISNLKRAEGVQKWYEGNVVNTAKKIAKQNGMDFELKEIKGIPRSMDAKDTEFANRFVRDPDFQEENLDEAIDLLWDYNHTPESVEAAGGTWEAIAQLLDDAPKTHYAIIKPKGYTVKDQAYEDKLVEFNDLLSDGVSLESKRAERLMDELGIPTDVDPEDWMVAKFEELGDTGVPKKFKAERPNLKLYSSPAAAVAAGYASLKAGGTEDDVRFELTQAGYDTDEMDEMIADINFAKESVEVHGDAEEEVLAFFKSKEPEVAERTSVPIDQPVEKSFWQRLDDTAQAVAGNPKQEAYGAILSDEGMTAEQLLSRLQVIQPNMSSVTTRIGGYFGNETDARKQEEAVKASAQHIVNLAQKHGINLAFQPNPEGGGLDMLAAHGGGRWFTTGPDGQAVPVDEGFWEALRQESHEITYGVTGAIGGAKAAAHFTRNPWLIALGSVTGAITGAGVGTELDYLRDSVVMHEEMSANVAAHKALTAAEASVIGDAVGYPLVKGAGLIWKATKAAKDFLWDGNTAGAYKALKDTMFLDDSEIADITNALNKATTTQSTTTTSARTFKDYDGNTVSRPVVHTVEAPTGLEEQIQATILTQPGAEAIVKAAASIDAQTGSSVAKAIDTRAQDVLETTATLTDENVGRILAQDLSNYTNAVKQYYGNVKELVAKSPRINDFSWDYEKLAIKPVLETLQKNIMDPAVLERFVLQSNRINDMADSRTLTDLLELRQLVNDFKFNKRITKTKDFDALNEVLGNIDGAIRQGAEVVMENPQEWLQNYSLAKTLYAKMKGLERNVIARALRRPGLTEDTAVKALTKYITSIDGSFQDIMSALPKESRKLTEGAVIDVLANKFAAGTEGGQRAMHFPLLASELDKITFTMPEARKAKAALKEMAEVFRNDIPLSQATGNIQIPKFQSYLTVDPVVRAKFEIASGVFNWVKRLAPTAQQRNLALVSKTAKLLENPLNARLMKEVMEEVGGDSTLTKQLVDLQKEAARAKSQGDVGSAKVKLYGDGNVLSGKGSGKTTEIPIHRIATYEAQQTIANKYGIDLADKKLMDQALKGEGYMAAQLGSDKVRRIK